MMPLSGETLTRRSRRNHSPAVKAKVAVRGEKTLSGLEEQFDGHPNQISTWRQLLPKGSSYASGWGEKSAPAAPNMDVKTSLAKI